MKKFFAVVLSAFIMLTGCSKSTSSGYKAGTYTGVSENGMGGTVKVEVEFSDTEILSVAVVEHKETPNISDGAIAQIPQEIVDYQSLKIDAVSGATFTSNAILEAVCDAANQAGNACEELKEKDYAKKENNEVINLTTDLVVVGAGAAGLSAAVSAAYEGTESVVVFEKMPNIGGNAIVSGGFIENLNLPIDLRADNNAGYEAYVDQVLAGGPQNEDEEQYWPIFEEEVAEWKKTDRKALFDSPLWMAIEGVRTDGGTIEDYLYFVEALQSFDDWMEEFGVEWNKAHGIVGYNWPRWTSIKGYYSGQGFFHYLEKAIQDNNYPVDIYTNTPVTELVLNEEGEVIGVVAKSNDGTTYNVKSRKGVILATGGFAANGEMLVKYNTMWDGMTEDVLSTNTKGAMGDGIIMAEKIGAMTDLMDLEMMFPMADIKTGSTEAIVGASASALMVNKQGVRFTDETGTRWDISAAMFEQEDDLAYIISDSINSQIVNGKTQGGVDVAKMLDNGELYMADTLEELATKIGMKPETLVNTVNEYNVMASTHEDPQFGRTAFEPNSEITTGPYYAYPCTPGAHITIGGLVINYDTLQVVNMEGEDIPYLFAAGEVVAGQCGIDGSFADGRAIGMYVTHAVEARDFE